MILPGLGQVTVGRWRRGLAIVVAYCAGGLAFGALFRHFVSAFDLAARGYAAYDAWRLGVERERIEAADPPEIAPASVRWTWALTRLPWAAGAPLLVMAYGVLGLALGPLAVFPGVILFSGAVVLSGAVAGCFLLRETWRTARGSTAISAAAMKTEILVSVVVYCALAVMIAVALPAFHGLLRVSSEGRAKGDLGGFRLGVAAYRAAHNGAPPPDLDTVLPSVGMKRMPELWPWGSGSPHPNTREVISLASRVPTDSGRWAYVISRSSAEDDQGVFIDCTHTDTKGNSWSSY